MKRLNLKISGELAERFQRDADINKRGPQAEFEYLAEKALDLVEGRTCQQGRELADYIAQQGARA